MLAIVLKLDVLVLCALVASSFTVGFMLRSIQLKKARKKVNELEKEMLRNDAEILTLEKEKAALLHHMKESRIPVIPMKNLKDDNDKKEGNRQAN